MDEKDYERQAKSMFARTANSAKMRFDALGILRETMHEQLQFMEYRARMIRAFYQELIKSGFTEQQALELAKAEVSKSA